MNWGLWLNVVLTLAVVVAGIGWRRARWELRSLWDEFDAMRELAEGNEALVVLAAEKHNETLNRHVTDLMAEIERLKTEPPIPEPKSTPCGLFLPDALKPDEVQRILGQTLPETPWWKLINQVLITHGQRIAPARWHTRRARWKRCWRCGRIWRRIGWMRTGFKSRRKGNKLLDSLL